MQGVNVEWIYLVSGGVGRLRIQGVHDEEYVYTSEVRVGAVEFFLSGRFQAAGKEITDT